MTENKIIVERYMDGFNRSDHEQILSCLTEEDGGFLNAVFCDVFVMTNARIKRLTTYLAEVK